MINLFKAFRKKQEPRKETENVLIRLSEREERLPKYWDRFNRSLFLKYKEAQIS